MRRSAQGDPNKILTDQMSNFWLGCGAKRGPGALFSIDFRPWGGSAASIPSWRFPHFSPCDCSFCIVERGKRMAKPLIALSITSRPSRDWCSATLKTIVRPVQLGVLAAFNDGAAQTPSESPSGRLAWSIFKK